MSKVNQRLALATAEYNKQ